jgi:hypothetical protein
VDAALDQGGYKAMALTLADPALECLSIGVKNRDGGILVVDNGCEGSLLLDDTDIEPGEQIFGLAVQKERGEYSSIRTNSSFPQYIPQDNQGVEIQEILGEQ